MTASRQNHRLIMNHITLRNRTKSSPFGNFIDTLVIVAALSQTIIWLPQILKIFSSKNVEGISSLSILMIWITSIIWLSYGLYHKEKPLIISASGVSVCTTIILISIALYQ